MKLCITGSRHGRDDVDHWLDLWVDRFGVPELVIVGDQTGVDWQADQWVLRRGFPRVQEKVKPHLPSPQRYRERDQRMADHVDAGDWCLGFPIAGSQGTWLTLRLCRRRGATAYACPREPNPARARPPWEQWNAEKCGYCLGSPAEYVCTCTQRHSTQQPKKDQTP